LSWAKEVEKYREGSFREAAGGTRQEGEEGGKKVYDPFSVKRFEEGIESFVMGGRARA